MSVINKLKQYILEVKAETQKVSWPTRQRAMKDSAVVIAISLAAAAFLGGLDILLSEIFNKFVIK